MTHIIEFAVFTALLTLFLEFCFRYKNVFYKWPTFWVDWYIKRHPMPKFKKALTDEEIWHKRYEYVDDKWFWFAPLGGCVVCMNVWISFVFTPVFVFTEGCACQRCFLFFCLAF